MMIFGVIVHFIILVISLGAGIGLALNDVMAGDIGDRKCNQPQPTNQVWIDSYIEMSNNVASIMAEPGSMNEDKIRRLRSLVNEYNETLNNSTTPQDIQ